MDVGSKGLVELNMTIPQGTSLSFDIEHYDEHGNPVDHRDSIIKMCFESKDLKRKIDLSQCCTGTETGINVNIPYQLTAALPLQGFVWDMFVYTGGDNCTRFCYGKVRIVDTYSEDIG